MHYLQQYALIAFSLLLSIAISYLQYWFRTPGGKVSVFLSVIRSTIFFLLFLLLINPTVLRSKVSIQKPKLLLLVDNSSSIQFLNKDSTVHNIVGNFKAHQILNDQFDVIFYSFGNNFKLMDSLYFNERQTKISEPIQKIQRIYRNTNNAIVLLSDGNQTLGNDYE